MICSILVLILGRQARLSVHLQSIIERFPHDSTISLADASELNETTLSSSVAALNVSSSIKPSHSTKSHRPLTEIVEDAGETTVQEKQDENTNSIAGITTSVDPGVDAHRFEPRNDVTANGERRSSARKASLSSHKSPAAPSTKRSIETLSRASHDFSTTAGSSVDKRESSESTRPHAGGLGSSYKYKPKIKLAPRPSIDQGRTRNSDTYSRPVSTLPAGIRLSSRQPPATDRPQTQQASSKPFFSGSSRRPLASPAVSVISVTTTERPPSRAGSATSNATAPAYASYPDNKPSTVTPEKQRLMKALQKRKKNQMAKLAAKENTPDTDRTCQTNDPSDELGKMADKTQTLKSTQSLARQDQATLSDVIPNATSTKDETPANELHEARPTQAVLPTATSNTMSAKVEELVTCSHNPNETLPAQSLSSSTLETEEARTKGSREREPEHGQHGEEHKLPDGEEGMPIPGTPTSIKTDPLNPEELSGSGKSLPEPSPSHQPPEDLRDSMSKAQSPSDIALPPISEDETSNLQSATAFDSDASSTPKQETFAAASLLALAKDRVESEEKSVPAEILNSEAIDVSPERKTKGRTAIVPTKVADADDTTSLSGDSFLDELQTATVEEAKTITVSKSPATSFFPGSPKSGSSRRSSEGKIARSNSSTFSSDAPPLPSASISLITRMNSDPDDPKAGSRLVPSRSFSSPIDSIPTTAGLSSPQSGNEFTSRAGSTSPTQKRLPESDAPISKKLGLSSLISQRIKALEKFSGSSAQSSSTTATIITPALVSKRSASLATPPASAGNETPSLKINTSQTGSYPTPSPSPHGTFVGRRFRPARSASDDTRPTRESMTNTTIDSAPGKLTGISHLHDPQNVQHKSSRFSKATKKSSRSKSRSSASSVSSPRNSMTSANRESFSSRRSNASREDSIDTVRPLSSQSSDANSTHGGEKKESRKSRLMKRMSSITFSPRRTIAQALNPTLNDQPIIEHQEPEVGKGWRAPVTIGDLNVQFPDTLVSHGTLPPNISPLIAC